MRDATTSGVEGQLTKYINQMQEVATGMHLNDPTNEI